MGSHEAGTEEGKALFLCVGDSPARSPGRRVLHFELPAAGPGSGHLSAHATGADRARLADQGGAHTAARGQAPEQDGQPETPPVRLSVAALAGPASPNMCAGTHEPRRSPRPPKPQYQCADPSPHL